MYAEKDYDHGGDKKAVHFKLETNGYNVALATDKWKNGKVSFFISAHYLSNVGQLVRKTDSPVNFLGIYYVPSRNFFLLPGFF